MSRAKRILVVDDDHELLQMIGLILERANFEVLKADDGARGLTVAKETVPDLIILDVMMPEIDGMEVCRLLRADITTRHIPVIMMSALGDMDNKLKGFQVGADDYLPKPVNPKELVARVLALLNRMALTRPAAAQTFAFVGAKGGVGTTTVAMNVAARLAQMDFSVVLVELRPSGSTLRHLLRFQAKIKDFSPLLALEPGRIKRPEVERCLIPHSSGMQLMLAPVTNEHLLTAEHVDAIYDVLADQAQYIIFDCPPEPDAGMRRALEFTDQILLVTEPEALSVACAAVQVKYFKYLSVYDRVNMVIVERVPFGTTFNQVEVENKTGMGVLEHMKNARWDPRSVDMQADNRQGVVATIPSAPAIFHETARDRVPLIMVDPNAKPAHALLDLTDWLLEKNPLAPIMGHNNQPSFTPPAQPVQPNVENGQSSVSMLSFLGGD